MGIVVFAAILLAWARTSPGFDPYGWNDWGYQTLRLNLNLGGAPSWKPVTYFFTVPYALFGHYELRLWQVTSASVSLAGPIFAGRIVYKLVHESSEDRRAAWASAIFAGFSVLGIRQYTHYWLSSQSDSMLVTFSLAAIDMHLNNHPRWVVFFLWLSALGRPETWPFYGLYVLWAFRYRPEMRRYLVIATILIPVFWFGIPVLSGNPWDIASKLAELSPRACTTGKVVCVTQRYLDLTYWPIDLAALVGLGIAVWRRNRAVMIIAGCSVLWLLIEIAFAIHGFPGVPRYMFEAGAALIVVAGVAFGWLITEARKLGRGAGYAGLATAAALIVLLVPDALAQERYEHKDLLHERARTTEIGRMDAAIKALGGIHFIRSCGDPSADVEYVSIMAWYLHMNVGRVGHRPQYEINVATAPVVLFTALPSGWVVHTYHITAANQRRCAALNDAYYVVTPQHPGGYVFHQA